jgi:DNA-binding NarL/FixJ family response regulator
MNDREMLKLFVGGPSLGSLDSLLVAAEHRDDVEVVGVGRNGKDLAHAVKSLDVNALVVPHSWAELGRALRITLKSAPGTMPAYILGAEELSPSILVKTALFGYDGAVSVSNDPEVTLNEIGEIVQGRKPMGNVELLQHLGLRQGALARELRVDQPGDAEVADLVGAGLPDSDIATITGLSIQQVRNAVERLLHINGLTYRTQLAVLRAASWPVPDYT